MNAPTTSVTPDMPHPKGKMLGGTAEKVHPPGGAHGDLARDIVASRPDLIISVSGQFARLLKPVTATVPILATSADPIAGGLVTNLARPDGNITGVSVDAGLGVYGKRLQFLGETARNLTNVRLLTPPYGLTGHTLLVGANNVGKSTVCEALDLVLGPDRLSRFPAVEEFDFYNAEYLDGEGAPRPLRIEVLLTELSAEVENACGGHLEFWCEAERRILQRGEIELANAPATKPCLRLETIGRYDSEEDDFEAQTYFSHGARPDGSLEAVGKRIKRLIGFIYLRTLRTGSRALSLERNSLLDIILRVQGVRTGLWERSISRSFEICGPAQGVGKWAAKELVTMMSPVRRSIM